MTICKSCEATICNDAMLDPPEDLCGKCGTFLNDTDVGELVRLARLGAAVEAMPPLSCLCRRASDEQFEYDIEDGNKVARAPTAMEAIQKLTE